MLEISYLRENAAAAKEQLKVKNFKEVDLIDEILKLDEINRSSQKKLDDLLAESNRLSKEIGALYKQGKREEADKVKEQTTSVKAQSTELSKEKEGVEKQLFDAIVRLPNIPHSSVPNGNSEEDNEVIKTVGDIPKLHANAQPHWELAKKHELFDLELGVKITGAGFPVFKGKGARLQRALITYFLDKAVEAGYQEYIPPLLVNEKSAFGTGSLPDKEGQMYEMKEDPYFLIPTGEVPITNVYRDKIVNESDFPIKMTGYTPCFRREAGSYGKEVRGLNRVHQFDKVEIVEFAHPDKSYEVLERMAAYVEHLLQELGLPYRVLRLCGGDVSFASALTLDFEVYSTAQERWLEVSSVSNFETFQTNRMKLRFKDKDGKKRLAHSLNGSALALPRIYAALLENNQTEDGINIPEVLHSYTGFKTL